MFAVLSNADFDPPKTKKGMSVGSFPVQRQATKLSDLFLVLFLAPSKLRLCVHDLLFMVHLQRYGTRPTGNLRLTILEEYLFNFDETFFSQELTYFLVIVCLSFSLHLLVHACFSQSSSSNWHIFMFYLSVYLCYFLYLGPDAVKLIKMEQKCSYISCDWLEVACSSFPCYHLPTFKYFEQFFIDSKNWL